jgi:hypothetical protein
MIEQCKKIKDTLTILKNKLTKDIKNSEIKKIDSKILEEEKKLKICLHNFKTDENIDSENIIFQKTTSTQKKKLSKRIYR